MPRHKKTDGDVESKTNEPDEKQNEKLGHLDSDRQSFFQTSRSSLGVNHVGLLVNILELEREPSLRESNLLEDSEQDDFERISEERQSQILALKQDLNAIQQTYATELLNDLTKLIDELIKKRPKLLAQRFQKTTSLSDQLASLKERITNYNQTDVTILEKFEQYQEYAKEIENLLSSHNETELLHEFQHWYKPPMDLTEKDLGSAASDIAYVYYDTLIAQGLNLSYLPPKNSNYKACTDFYNEEGNRTKAAHVYTKFLEIRANITEFSWEKWNEVIEKEIGEIAQEFTDFPDSLAGSVSRLVNERARIADALMPNQIMQNMQEFCEILGRQTDSLDFSEEVEKNIEKTINFFITILEKSNDTFETLTKILLKNNPQWKNKNKEYIKLQWIQAFFQPFLNWLSQQSPFDAQQKTLMAICWSRITHFLNNIDKQLSGINPEIDCSLKEFLQFSLQEIAEYPITQDEKNILPIYDQHVEYDDKGIPILNAPFSEQKFKNIIDPASQLACIYQEIGIKSNYLLGEANNSYEDFQKIYSTTTNLSLAKRLLKTLPEEKTDLKEGIPQLYRDLANLKGSKNADPDLINTVHQKLSDYKYAYQLQALRKELTYLKILVDDTNIQSQLEKLINNITNEIKDPKKGQAQRDEKLIKLCLNAVDVLKTTSVSEQFYDWLETSDISFHKINGFVSAICQIYNYNIENPLNFKAKCELALSFDNLVAHPTENLAIWTEVVTNALRDSTKTNNKFADDYYLSTLLIPPALYREAENFLSRIREKGNIEQASTEAMAASAQILLDSFSGIFDSLAINDEQQKKELLKTCLISLTHFVEKKERGDEKAALQLYCKKLNKSLLGCLTKLKGPNQEILPLNEILRKIADQTQTNLGYEGNDEATQQKDILSDNYTCLSFLINPDSRKGTLNLTHAKILNDHDNDVAYLQKMLVKYPELKGLNLSNNPFTSSEKIAELMKVLLNNNNLTEVDFGNHLDKIGEDNRNQIIQKLDANLTDKITALSLKETNDSISPEEKKELQRARNKKNNSEQLAALSQKLKDAKEVLDKKWFKSNLRAQLDNLIQDIQKDLDNPASQFNKNHNYVRRAKRILEKDADIKEQLNTWLNEKKAPADAVIYAAANMISIHKYYLFAHKNQEPLRSILNGLPNLEQGEFNLEGHKSYIEFYSKFENALAAQRLIGWVNQNASKIYDWNSKNNKANASYENYKVISQSVVSDGLTETLLTYLVQGDVLDLSDQKFSNINLEDVKAFLNQHNEIKALRINKDLNDYQVRLLLFALDGCNNLLRLNLSENKAVFNSTKRNAENLLLVNLKTEMIKNATHHTKNDAINNRYQLIKLKQILEKLEEKSSGKISFHEQIEEAVKNLESGQFNNLLLVRQAARILEENKQQGLLNELSTWYKKSEQEKESLYARDADIIEAAVAIAYIYQDYLKQPFQTYQVAFDHYNNPDNLNEAKRLYNTFMNKRPEFEDFYQQKWWNPFSGSSYKARWKELVMGQASRKILGGFENNETDMARLGNDTPLLDNVLIPFNLLQLLHNSDKIAKEMGKKTGSVFLAEQKYHLEMLGYIQKQFFETPDFFDDLFAKIKADSRVHGDKKIYLSLLEKTSAIMSEKSKTKFRETHTEAELAEDAYLDFCIKSHEENIKMIIASLSLSQPVFNIQTSMASPSKCATSVHFSKKFSSPSEKSFVGVHLSDQISENPSSKSLLETKLTELSHTIRNNIGPESMENEFDYLLVLVGQNYDPPSGSTALSEEDRSEIVFQIFPPQSWLYKIGSAISNSFAKIGDLFKRTQPYEGVPIDDANDGQESNNVGLPANISDPHVPVGFKESESDRVHTPEQLSTILQSIPDTPQNTRLVRSNSESHINYSGIVTLLEVSRGSSNTSLNTSLASGATDESTDSHLTELNRPSNNILQKKQSPSFSLVAQQSTTSTSDIFQNENKLKRSASFDSHIVTKSGKGM